MKPGLKLVPLESREVPASPELFGSFAGEVTVLSADVNDDGVNDVIAAPQAGGGPHIRVIDGATAADRLSFLAYDAEFRGGVTLAVGDVNGDGRADIITGAGVGGGPHVRAFSGVDGSPLFNAYAYDPGFRGGLYVAAADFDDDGRDDIVTGAGPGGGPHVRCFDVDGRVVGDTMIGDVDSRLGIRVGSAPYDSEGPALLTSRNGETQLSVYRGFTGQSLGKSVRSVDSKAWSLPNVSKSNDIISDWNDEVLRAIRAERTPPPRAARALAIVHTAIFDAVNAIERDYEAYLPQPEAPLGASTTAAAIEAGYRTALALFPQRASRFEQARNQQLAALPGTGISEGLTVGATAAALMLADRAKDQPAPIPYTSGTQPGQWRPTPSANAPFALPDWGRVRPFVMSSGDQFRPAPSPELTSSEYAAAFEEVKQLGSVSSSLRTAEQTEIALLWAANPGTDTPPGMTNRITANLVARRNLSLLDSARTFALVNLALADAAIVAWDAKRVYNWWRPITAIHEADADGNPSTIADASWVPLLPTPNHPDHTSGHSTFTSAGAAVLAALFGDETEVTAWAADRPNVARTFDRITSMAEEAGQSRIYGGIHTQYANQAGLESGERLGKYVIGNEMQAVSRQ
ncbi:MAG: hypothetical protein ACRC8S_00865 [Fimbriiglobus sp.]